MKRFWSVIALPVLISYALSGQGQVPDTTITIFYDYGISCPENELTLNVDIVQGAAAVPDNVVYHAMIPKQKDGGTIVIKINVK